MRVLDKAPTRLTGVPETWLVQLATTLVADSLRWLVRARTWSPRSAVAAEPATHESSIRTRLGLCLRVNCSLFYRDNHIHFRLCLRMPSGLCLRTISLLTPSMPLHATSSQGQPHTFSLVPSRAFWFVLPCLFCLPLQCCFMLHLCFSYEVTFCFSHTAYRMHLYWRLHVHFSLYYRSYLCLGIWFHFLPRLRSSFGDAALLGQLARSTAP